MEESIVIQNQAVNIYGVLNSTERANKLIIFVHGLGGDYTQHLFFNSAQYFPQHGFDTFRFDLYSGRENARKLEHCDTSTHTADLDMVIQHFLNDYQSIYLIGHSLGGLVVLRSSLLPSIKRVVFWDASQDFLLLQKDYQLNKHMNLYYKHASRLKFIGKDLYNEWGGISIIDLLRQVSIPTKLIFAGKNRWATYVPQIEAIENESLSCEIIDNVNHCFDEEGAEDLLFKSTRKYLDIA